MIQTLINWAEIIGGLAVVISLIFVAIQIRSSVIQSRADSYTKVSELWLNFTSVIASNEETWRIFHKGTNDYETFTPEEKARFGFLISMYFGIIETLLNYRKVGLFDDSEIHERNLDQAYPLFIKPGVQAWYSKSKGRVFAPSVEKYIVERRARHRNADT
ncbi:hypothetical protein N9M08_03590 [Porticoccaceae bacterium]|nr:hypothetical protein [Porticoccaceae bacterium]MDB2634214.1 hypothetical protein [Porticoccaceae bacterium]